MEKTQEKKVYFYEKQRFTQWWFWTIILLVFLIPFAIAYYKISAANGYVDPKISRSLINYVIAEIISLAVIFSIKLETKITEDGISVRFFPFGFKFRLYPFADMAKCYIRKYSPVKEYGGWGLKGSINNRALNISGNMGLQIEFVSGKKLLIGTRRFQEIYSVLESLRNGKL